MKITAIVFTSLYDYIHIMSEKGVLYDETLIAGLKILNPFSAVEANAPGICGWKCSSFMLNCPWWMNSSCGGYSASAGSALACATAAVSSASTLRSHTVSWLSALHRAITDSSCGAHSMEVMGPRW